MVGLGAALIAAPAVAEKTSKLDFVVTEGNVYNRLYRDGAVAAHLLLKSGDNPP
jgi:hypothetical protein